MRNWQMFMAVAIVIGACAQGSSAMAYSLLAPNAEIEMNTTRSVQDAIPQHTARINTLGVRLVKESNNSAKERACVPCFTKGSPEFLTQLIDSLKDINA